MIGFFCIKKNQIFSLHPQLIQLKEGIRQLNLSGIFKKKESLCDCASEALFFS